ncbi:MAG: hypothetical protein M3275_09650 [Thermoproteota archaeon]|jgi:hypothetical protein|nr:hypothetical protein [Thermoproteota archaeon]HYZ58949.1 hypothetical protein [Nitrososphaeraceae archaeon]
MVVLTTADYLQIITAAIYAAALFYTILTFRRSKRLDQLTITNEIFLELRNLDRVLAKIPLGPQYDDARSQTYSRIFTTLDYLSFLINQKVVDDRRLMDYMKADIIRYYEEAFLKHASIDERDSNSYQQFKKLYLKVKK